MTDTNKADMEPVANGATHIQPITGGLYKKIDGIWYVWSRMEDEPRKWIKSLGTAEKYLEPLIPSPALAELRQENERLKEASDFDHAEYKRLRDNLSTQLAEAQAKVRELVEALESVAAMSEEAGISRFARSAIAKYGENK